jgi:membrane protein implicated in regulation of membrane protease activity
MLIPRSRESVSALSWAWFAVAVLVGVLVVVLCVVMANLFRVLTSTKELIDGVTRETVPTIGQVRDTVTLVNQELVRVDGILATAEGVTSSVGNLVNVVSSTVTSPLVKLSAFAWGLRRAAGAAAGGDEPAGRSRSRSRFRSRGRRRR